MDRHSERRRVEQSRDRARPILGVLVSGLLVTTAGGLVSATPAQAVGCNVENWDGLIYAFGNGVTAVLCRPISDADQSPYTQLAVRAGRSAAVDLNGWSLTIKNTPAGQAGITVPPKSVLTVRDTSLLQLGVLKVTGGDGTVGGGGGAGIGGAGGKGAIVPTQGSDGTGAGTLNIAGGNVIATGGSGSNNPVYGAGGGGGGAGIGGGGAGAGDGPGYSAHVRGGNGGAVNLLSGHLTSAGGTAGMSGPYALPGAGGGAGIGGGGGAGTGRGKTASGYGGDGGAVRLAGGTLQTAGGTGRQRDIDANPTAAGIDSGGGGAGIGSGGGGPDELTGQDNSGNITVVPGAVRISDSGPGSGGNGSSRDGQEPQQVILTSTPPLEPALGGTYRVKAMSTFGTSGQPIVLTTPGPENSCSLSTDGSTVMFARGGICTINADQAGTNGYDRAPTVTQTFTIQPGHNAG
jgi:hypothetical protein